MKIEKRVENPSSAEQLLEQLKFLAEVETYKKAGSLDEILDRITEITNRGIPATLRNILKCHFERANTNTPEGLESVPAVALKSLISISKKVLTHAT